MGVPQTLPFSGKCVVNVGKPQRFPGKCDKIIKKNKDFTFLRSKYIYQGNAQELATFTKHLPAKPNGFITVRNENMSQALLGCASEVSCSLVTTCGKDLRFIQTQAVVRILKATAPLTEIRRPWCCGNCGLYTGPRCLVLWITPA